MIFYYLCNIFNSILRFIMRIISICHLRLRQLSVLRKRRKYNLIHKKMRYIRACKPRIKHKRLRYSDSSEYLDALPVYKFIAPSNFSLNETPEDVINYIDSTKEDIQRLKYRCKVNFDLSNVKLIDNGGIGMLLSLVNFLSKHKVPSYGNVPNDEMANIALYNSGFFEHVKMLQGKKSRSNDKFIVQSGSSVTNSIIISKESRKVMNYLMGINSSYKPIYSLIGEIISNSIEHANHYHQDKNWLLSVHYEEQKVSIMVMDIGLGILATLRKKISQKVKDITKFTSNIDTLYNLFDRKYQSSTFESNRNKGLPKIKDCFENNYISNLNVITNNAFLDFNRKNSRKLNANFQGTFYYWEITKTNIEKWQNRIN